MIREYYINLDRCQDKRQRMESRFPDATRIAAVDGKQETPESILPYVSDRNWRDPYWNRRMTFGEVGCTLSHIKAWKTCVELDEPIIVLEDDVIINQPYYQEVVSTELEDNDFVYLGKKTIDGLFCYWTCAYAITPVVAQALLTYHDNNPIIPADEVLPAILDTHRWPHLNQGHGFASKQFDDNLIEPEPGAFDNSGTESMTDIWPDYDFHVITVGTHEDRLFRIPQAHNLGKGVEWKGGTMEGPGGGQKLNLVKPHLKTLDPNDIVMFIDGYDTFVADTDDVILDRYFSFGVEVVFSAEKICWPDQSMADQFREQDTAFRYLNSGTYIGTVKELLRMLEDPIQDHEDDQLYMQKQFLSNQFDAVLDTESYIFFCLSGAEHSIGINSYSQVVNTETNCCTSVVHGNGGDATKVVFDGLYDKLYNNSGLKTRNNPDYKRTPLSHDIVKVSGLITENWCERLIQACEDDGGWRQLPNDKFPGQEIRLNRLEDKSFIEDMRDFYINTLKPEAEDYWDKLLMNGMRDLFVIKYKEEQQTHLPLHHDMSLVTFTVKLNDEYEGGLLNFPRQGVTNESLDVGDIIYWPSGVTHPHESLRLESGTKYSLVMWTGRTDDEREYYEQQSSLGFDN